MFYFARVAQGWSTTLPRWGPRVRIPSRALFINWEILKNQGFPVFLCSVLLLQRTTSISFLFIHFIIFLGLKYVFVCSKNVFMTEVFSDCVQGDASCFHSAYIGLSEFMGALCAPHISRARKHTTFLLVSLH